MALAVEAPDTPVPDPAMATAARHTDGAVAVNCTAVLAVNSTMVLAQPLQQPLQKLPPKFLQSS